MSRWRARANTISVSLFPFLAVLLCTMGALILLLIIISRTARAKSIETEDAVLVRQDLEAERDLLELRIEQLTQQRDRTQDDLRQRQLELGHLEVEAQKLRAQLDEMIAMRDALDKDQALSAQARTELEFEISRRQAEIARKRLELDQLRRGQAGMPPSYAVIPYHGPNATRRPPIYIECRADAVLLQPEGIVLRESDFEGPMGPGNPLAAAMRATREHMARQRRSSDGETGEPYPMLLVRPDGIDAYWVARDALQSWGTDFGYELVDADWDLAYREPDLHLSQQVTQAVEVAREQQRLLAQMAPRSFGRSSRVFRANPTGGGVIANGAGGRGPGRGGAGSQSGGPYPGQRGFGSGSGNAFGGDSPDGDLMPPEEPLGSGEGQFAGQGRSGRMTDGQHSTIGNPYASAADGEPTPEGTAGAAFGQAGQYGQSGQHSAAGQHGATNQFAQSNQGTANMSGRPGQSAGQPGSPLDTSGRSSAGASSAAGTPPPFSHDSQMQSMARQRGKNWGLPDAVRGATPITRPITLQCRRDSIAILSDDGRRRPVEVISFAENTAESIDPLIGAVWKHIEGWGIAGHGMYWHPILMLDVQPSGDGRAADLEALLADSGIQIERRGANRTANNPLPANNAIR